jgi:hypothetical protein
LASKQYISIIRLFEHCGISTAADVNLARARKQLVAEFGIAQDGFIEVDGYTYSRHDVLEEIDHPAFLQRLVFHNQIWKSPQILELLENNVADMESIDVEFRPFTKNKEFDIFFSPYFAGPFAYLSRKYLGELRMHELGKLYGYEDFLQPEEREEAFQPVRIFLEENKRLLHNVNGQNYSIMRPKIIPWIETDWSIFFNSLPHEFYDLKVDIATRLVNIGVEIQKKKKSDCRSTSTQLYSLEDIPEHLRKVIASNHLVYHRKSGSGSSGWRSGWWIIWVFIMLIRAVSSDGCEDSSSKFQYPPGNLQIQQPSVIDSIMQKLRSADTSLFKRNIDSLLKKSVKGNGQ